MTMIISGDNGLTFPNSTVQASAGLTAASPTIASGVLTYPNGATNGGYINGGTAVASTSGTSIDFTSIPSWVKRITVMLNGVSLNGTAHLLVQIGVGSTPTTSGYSSTSSYALASGSASGGVSSTAGYVMYVATASYVFSGHMVITNISGNIWVCSGLISNATTTPYTGQTAGTGSVASTLGMVRITTTNGTDTFDAGSINILYE